MTRLNSGEKFIGASSLAAILSMSASLPGAYAQDNQDNPSYGPGDGDSFEARWTGISVGVGGGINFFTGSPRLDVYESWTSYEDSETFDFDINGIFGTAEIGFDKAFNKRWVAGVYADVSVGNVSEAFGFSDDGSDYDIDYAARIKFKEKYSLIARLGYEVSQRTLLYGLAGYSLQKYEAYVSQHVDSSDLYEANDDGFMGAVIVGAGAETLLSERTSLKLEYRFSHANGIDVASHVDDGEDYWADFETGNINTHTVRGVMSFKF